MSYSAFGSSDPNNSMASANFSAYGGAPAGGGFVKNAGGGGFGGGGGAGSFAGGGAAAYGASPGDSPSGKRPRKSQSMTPVTARMAVEAADQGGQLFVNGRVTTTVTLVGCIAERKNEATLATWTVTDGTGAIGVQRFLNSGPSEDLDHLRKGVYVRVFGTLQKFQGRSNINYFHMEPVTDFNEVSFHMLEVIHTHLAATRSGAAAGAAASSANAAYGAAAPAGAGGVLGPAIAAGAADAAGANGLTGTQAAVMRVFEASGDSDAGETIANVAAKLPHVRESEIRAAVEFLTSEGHLYSTIDEDHFKSTNA